MAAPDRPDAQAAPPTPFSPEAEAEERDAPVWYGRQLQTPISQLAGGEEYEKLLADEEAGKRRGFREAFFDVDKKSLPFVGDLVDLKRIRGVGQTAKKLAAQEAVSDQDLLDFNRYLLEQERAEHATILGKAGDVMRTSATFGAELAVIAGLGSASGGAAAIGPAGKKVAASAALKTAKKMTHKAITKALKKQLGTKLAAKTSRVLIRAAELNMKALAFDALRPGAIPSTFERRKLNNILTGKDEDDRTALFKSILDTHIEHFSEMTGADLGVLGGKLIPKAAKAKFANMAIGQMIAHRFKNPTVKKIADFAKTAGYDGMLQEMGEERVGGFLRGLFGVQGEAGIRNAFKEAIPSFEQMAVEAIAFSAPSAAMTAASTLIDRDRDMLKGLPPPAQPQPGQAPGPGIISPREGIRAAIEAPVVPEDDSPEAALRAETEKLDMINDQVRRSMESMIPDAPPEVREQLAVAIDAGATDRAQLLITQYQQAQERAALRTEAEARPAQPIAPAPEATVAPTVAETLPPLEDLEEAPVAPVPVPVPAASPTAADITPAGETLSGAIIPGEAPVEEARVPGTSAEAERMWSDGYRMFAVSEQDETPTEVTSFEALQAYTPEQIFGVRPKAAVDVAAQEPAKELTEAAPAATVEAPIQEIAREPEPQREELPAAPKPEATPLAGEKPSDLKKAEEAIPRDIPTFDSRGRPVKKKKRKAPPPSEAQLRQRAEFGRRSQPVNEQLAAFREEYTFIRRPDVNDPVRDEVITAVGTNRVRKDPTLSTWDVVLEAAKDRGLAPADATAPEALAPIFRGRLQTVGESETQEDEQIEDRIKFEVEKAMTAQVKQGIQPTQEIIEQFPDVYEAVLEKTGVDPESLVPEAELEVSFDVEEIEAEAAADKAATRPPEQMAPSEFAEDQEEDYSKGRKDFTPPPVGTWRIDKKTGEIEQLQSFNIDDIKFSEPVDAPSIQPSVEEYTKWWEQGFRPHPPTIIRRQDGTIATLNRRRVLAAKRAGETSILGWFSDLQRGKGFSGTTHESVVREAIEDGRPVSAEALSALDIEVPEGWSKQGELYIPPAPAPTFDEQARTGAVAPERGLQAEREQVAPEDLLGGLSAGAQQQREQDAAQREAEERFLALMEQPEAAPAEEAAPVPNRTQLRAINRREKLKVKMTGTNADIWQRIQEARQQQQEAPDAVSEPSPGRVPEKPEAAPVREVPKKDTKRREAPEEGAQRPQEKVPVEKPAAKAKPKKKAKAKKKRAPAEQKKIEDFGEKIGGAKKDIWAARTMEVKDLDQMTDREAVDLVKKNEIFPVPDYQALTDQITKNMAGTIEKVAGRSTALAQEYAPEVPAATAFLIKQIRDSMPAKLKGQPSRQDLQDYVEAVGMVREKLQKIRTSADLSTDLLTEIFGDDITVGRSYYRSLNNDAKYYNHVRLLGNRFLKAVQVSNRDMAKAMVKVKRTGFPAKQEAWHRQYRVGGGTGFDILEATSFRQGAPSKFFIIRDPAIGVTWNGDQQWTKRADAEAWMKDNLEGKYYVVPAKSSRIVQDGFDTKFAAQEWAKSNAKKAKERDKPPVRPQLANINRVGEDYRKGRDITEQEFLDTFGFRGGEFGNWTSQADRQQSLNFAYDALMDLANVLEVPPRAISLNGELGMAFGARGSGGALAHYEPTKIVINLTKMRGAGALAHEWAHAVDDYFGRLSGDKAEAASDIAQYFVSHGISDESTLRPEIIESWRSIMRAITERPADVKEQEASIALKEKNLARNIQQWADRGRRSLTDTYGKRAALPEELKQWDDLVRQAKTTDPGATIPDPRSRGRVGRDTFKITEAMNELYRSVKGKILPKDVREGINNNLHWVGTYRRRRAAIASGEIQNTVRTHYLEEAKEIDARKKPYWALRHEMFARAFEAWVYDQMRDAKKQSDYLVHSATNLPIWKGKPYPEGQERQSINTAFDEFRQNLLTQETEKGIQLYSAEEALDTDGQLAYAIEDEQKDIQERFPGSGRDTGPADRDDVLLRSRSERKLTSARQRITQQPGATDREKDAWENVQVDAEFSDTLKARQARMLFSAVGTDVVFVKNAGFDGVYDRQQNLVVLNSEISQDMIDMVAMHEMFHVLERNGLSAAGRMIDLVDVSSKAFQKYRQELERRGWQQYFQNYARQTIPRRKFTNPTARRRAINRLIATELIADFFGGRDTKFGVPLAEALSSPGEAMQMRFDVQAAMGDMAREEAGYGEEQIVYATRDELAADAAQLTPQDTEYLAAVERGELGAAQRMVDAAADKAGYKTSAYHGTNEQFTVFEKGRKSARGILFSAIPVETQGFFFAETEKDAQEFGSRVIPSRLSLDNPLVDPNRDKALAVDKFPLQKEHEIAYILTPLFEKRGEDYVAPVDLGIREVYAEKEDLADTPDAYDRAESYSVDWIYEFLGNEGIAWDVLDNQEVVSRMQELGYDGTYVEEKFGSSIFVPNASQIKSAAAVTRDDAGNVIPLSERFQAEAPDIRYSAREDAPKETTFTPVPGVSQEVLDKIKELEARERERAKLAKPKPLRKRKPAAGVSKETLKKIRKIDLKKRKSRKAKREEKQRLRAAEAKQIPSPAVSREELSKALRDQRTDILTTQQQIRKYIYTMLPQDVRGKAITQIEKIAKPAKKATREKYAREVMQVIDDLAANAQRRLLRKQVLARMQKEYVRLRRFAGRTPSPRSTEANRRMKEYLDALSTVSPRREQNLSKTLTWFLENPQEQMPQELSKSLEAIFTPNVYQMDSQQLKQTLADISSIDKKGRTVREEAEAKEEERQEAEVKASIEQLRKHLKDDPQSRIAKALRKGSPRRRRQVIRDLARNYGWSHIRPERIVDWFQGFEGDAFKRNTFMPILQAEYQKLQNMERMQKRFTAIHEKLNIARAINRPLLTITIEGEKVPLTLDNMMFIYANSQNDGNRAHLIGTGITEDVIDMIESRLPREAKAAVDEMIDYYDNEQYPRMSAEFAREHHVDMPKEQRYFPIQNLDTNRAENAVMSDLIARFSARSAATRKGMTRSRVHSKAPFKELSYFKTVVRNLQQVEHYLAFNDPVRKVNRFLNNADMKDTMQEKSEEATGQLQDWLRSVAYGRVTGSEQVVDKVSDFLRTNYVTAVLGFNLVTMLKQPASFAQGLRRLKPGDAVHAARYFIAHPKRTIKFVQDRSVMMKNRMTSVEREIAEILEKGEPKRILGTQSNIDKFKELSMAPIQRADQITTTILWYAKFRELVNEGSSEAQAAAAADKLIRQTQPMGGIVHLAKLYRGGGLARAYTMFTNQLNQNANLVWEMGANYRGPKSTLLDIGMYMLVPSMLIYMASSGGRPPWLDLKGWAKAFVSNITGGLMFLNKVFQALMMALTGERRGASLLLDLTPTSFSGLEDVIMAIAQANPTQAFDAMTKLTGLPSAQAKRAVRGIQDFVDTKDPRYLVWSKFALEGPSGGGAKGSRRSRLRARKRTRSLD